MDRSEQRLEAWLAPPEVALRAQLLATSPIRRKPVRTYVTGNQVEPVYLEGEVVVGATIPEPVVLTPVPDYDYPYAYVNGQPVFIDPATRQIVYIVR